jgi:polyhydroxybutyrate depolymerase
MKRWYKLLLLLIAGSIALTGCRRAADSDLQISTPASVVTLSGNDQKYSLTTPDGRVRTYIVHLPAGYNANKTYPLVLVLHGGLGSAESVAAMSGMSSVADINGFLVVYPQGASHSEGRQLRDLPTWNAGQCCGYAMRENIDDVTFIRQLIAQASMSYSVDPSKILVAGISNGGMMAQRLACEAADLFAGAATVAGSIQVASCTPSRPIPLVMIHGTADDAVPYEGGTGSNSMTRNTNFPPVEQQIYDWAARNICAGEPATEAVPPIVDDGVRIDKMVFSGCAASVILYRITGGTHSWPGGKPGVLQEASRPTQAFDASASIWEFFASE